MSSLPLLSALIFTPWVGAAVLLLLRQARTPRRRLRQRLIQITGRSVQHRRPVLIRRRCVRWRDLRLILGLALIVVAMVIGWRLLAAPADTVKIGRAHV